MNPAQIHLAFTHLPVILSLVALVTLIISFFVKNIYYRRISFYIFAAAGLTALPVFFSGEGAEEMVEGLPGVSEAIIEEHETVAKLAFIAILAGGLLAVVALWRSMSPAVTKTMAMVVLLAGLVSTGLMTRAAHLGGQIRHSEIRTGAVAQAGENENGENKGNGKEGKKDKEKEDEGDDD